MKELTLEEAFAKFVETYVGGILDVRQVFALTTQLIEETIGEGCCDESIQQLLDDGLEIMADIDEDEVDE